MDKGIEMSDDPGWTQAFREAAWGAVPGLGIRRTRQRFAAGRIDGLTMLRALFLTFPIALVLVGLVVAIIDNSSNLKGQLSAVAVGVAVALIGFAALVAFRLVPQPLDCTSSEKLAGSYRTRYFVRMAFSEVPALCGFAGFILTANGWMYGLSVPFSAVGFFWNAPTARHLGQDQRELDDRGCGRSLAAALRSHMPPVK